MEQKVELGTMEMEETKIGRLEHKIAKLQTLGERTPGVEFMRSEVFLGRSRLSGYRARTVRRHRLHHPRHALVANHHRQRREHDCVREHVGRQSASSGEARGGRRSASFQRGHSIGILESTT